MHLKVKSLVRINTYIAPRSVAGFGTLMELLKSVSLVRHPYTYVTNSIHDQQCIVNDYKVHICN